MDLVNHNVEHVADEVFVVLSDLHANARALRAALALVYNEPFDHLVILGDLLTYGCEIDEVIEMVGDAQRSHRAALIVGNHDQLYFDLARGVRDYYATLPDWLRETVDHTFERLDIRALRDGLSWSLEHAAGDILFSHANPYEPADWSYLNSDADHLRAATRLTERGYRVGVFGHTHRRRSYFRSRAGAAYFGRGENQTFTHTDLADAALVLNPGSLGQPRESDGRTTFLRMHRHDDRLDVDFVNVEYDVAGHVQSVQSSTMSDGTKRRLCSFFAPARGCQDSPAGARPQ